MLKRRIEKDGLILDGDVLRVDSFINHKIDIHLLKEIGIEFHRLFADCGVNKILTIEASGIGIACMTAQFFDCDVVFAKKSKTSNSSGNVYSAVAHSYTHGNDNTITVDRNYITPEDKVLIIDDFLANGCAMEALISIVNEAGAELIGAGAVIEKVYQGGGNRIRERGIRVESLARIASMESGKITFC